MFNKQSGITRVNNNQNIEVIDMFADVFTLAEKISNDTNGAFDITVAPLVNAWGFGFKNGQLPTQSMVDSLKTFVGYKRVTLIDKHVKKADPRTTLDCGAIAKGNGSDMVAELLRRKVVVAFATDVCLGR